MIFLAISLHATEIRDAQQAVDVSGKQRMLTQRMMLDYVMIGMHSNFKNPQKDLTDTIEMFEKNLHAIAQYSSAEKIRNALVKAEEAWVGAKKILIAKADKKQCETLQTVLDSLLALSNQVVVEIKKDSGTDYGEIVDVSGRQRMLSQRIAGLYLMDLWLQSGSSKKALRKAMHAYESAYRKIWNFEHNSEEIKKYLTKAEKAYLYIKSMKGVGLPMRTMPAIIYKKSHDILVNMDRATHLYAAVMQKVASVR